MNVELITRLIRALNEAGCRYTIFGGAALNLWGLARFTEDLDLFVEPTRENVDKLKQSLRAVFADPTIDEITSDDLLGEYPAVQYNPPEGSFHVDILTRLGDAFRFSELESQTIDFNGVPATVVTPRQLYRMKRDTVRLKDRADAEALRQRFDLKEDE